MDAFEAELRDLQPSQLYTCTEKLAEVEGACADADDALASPLPVKRMGSRIVLTDGRTRALAAFRQGRTSVPVYWETDELDWGRPTTSSFSGAWRSASTRWPI